MKYQVRRKRADRCYGNHPELQAFAELYCRKIEVYDSSRPVSQRGFARDQPSHPG
jgi:hypothetical protein